MSALDPLIVPALDPVMVPVLEPDIVPAREPVIVPTREPLVREPGIVPAEATVVSERVKKAANEICLKVFILFLLANAYFAAAKRVKNCVFSWSRVLNNKVRSP
jgi:hypothetical protein